MNPENETLQYYNQDPDAFIAHTVSADMSETRERFCGCLPKGALILDFGCGSGRDTKAFLAAGYRVEAADGSAELCARASEYTGIPVQQMLFRDLNAQERYDGIWACASILHLPKDELADVLPKIEAALKPGCILYTSFKYGESEGVRGGRYFTDFTAETLQAFWQGATSMAIFDLWMTHDVRAGREDEQWINLLARRGRGGSREKADPGRICPGRVRLFTGGREDVFR